MGISTTELLESTKHPQSTSGNRLKPSSNSRCMCNNTYSTTVLLFTTAQSRNHPHLPSQAEVIIQLPQSEPVDQERTPGFSHFNDYSFRLECRRVLKLQMIKDYLQPVKSGHSNSCNRVRNSQTRLRHALKGSRSHLSWA